MATSGVLLEVCLNGSRDPGAHPLLPVTPEQLAESSREAVAAGAAAVHVHPRQRDGRQTLDAGACARALRAIRGACPGVPVGLTTGAWIEPDPERRLGLVSRWEVAPDFASVNLSEPGAVQLALRLLGMGIGVEPGLWSVADAETLVASGLAARSLRLLLAPMEEDTAAALATVAAIEGLLGEAGVETRQLQHGQDGTAWPVLRRALDTGRDVRIGLEDVLELLDGSPASGNAELVAAAARLAREAGRPLLGPEGRGRGRGDVDTPGTGLWPHPDHRLEVEP
ncbi:MAG TPA: 3-keto-5-aminohexanoate cleavage protein [Actinomycetes bacterium]|jgi:uncharacterized protein (DUF849 family)|nr:3-keto-5-aminohexanoate cleavage protein [Actinomycetes bacterium]